MKKIAVLMAVCLCSMAIALTACNGKLATNIDGGSITLEGSQLTIALEGNITTGFDWTDSVDGNNLKLADSTYQTSGSNSTAAGAGGVRSFVYKVEGTGTTTLTFEYARSWENEKPMETRTLTVSVKDGKVTQIDEPSSGRTFQFK